MAWDYKEWYRLNKKEVNEERKRKYHSDKEYRERQRELSRKSYKKAREAEPAVTDRRIIKQEGLPDTYFSIGKLASTINRAQQTIREYHNKGILPEVTAVDNRGWRLYSLGQVLLIKHAFQKFDRGEFKNLAELSLFLHREWDNEK